MYIPILVCRPSCICSCAVCTVIDHGERDGARASGAAGTLDSRQRLQEQAADEQWEEVDVEEIKQK